jgi:hypothetical protein
MSNLITRFPNSLLCFYIMHPLLTDSLNNSYLIQAKAEDEKASRESMRPSRKVSDTEYYDILGT